MKWIIPVAVLMLAGCGQSAGEKAEAEYRLVEKHAVDHTELCAPARKAAAAYLEAGDEKKYEHWNIMASAHCT